MKTNMAKLFLIISLFFGTLFVFIVPSFNSPDEDSHFVYSYLTSKGDFIPKLKNKKVGFDVPISILESIEKTKTIANDREKKYTYVEMYNDQLLPQDFNDKKFSNTVIKDSPKIAYLAPAIGIFIADNIHIFSAKTVSTHVLLQFARFFSLLIYSIIGFYAIKITPKFKKSFFAILLLPVALFLRSMVTYDGILLVVVALALAELLKLIYEKNNINKIDYAILIITGFILLNVKIMYSIVFFALFSVPKEVFGGKKKKIKSILLIGGSILLLTLARRIPYMVVGDAVSNSRLPEQLNYIMNHPKHYAKILISNIIGQRRIQEYWMLGNFGYLDTYVPVLLMFILRIYLILVFIIDSLFEKIVLPLWLKIGYFLLILFDIAGMYTLMYLSWTVTVTKEIGGSVITGIQGRYYLPFLFLIPIILNNKIIEKIPKKSKFLKIINKFKDIFDNNFYYITITSLVLVVFILVIRYYC